MSILTCSSYEIVNIRGCENKMANERLTVPNEKSVDWNALGQVIDTSFGRSSTTKSASYSVKVQMLTDEQMLVSYMAIVNFGAENEKLQMRRRFEDESKDIINDALKRIKKEYSENVDKDVDGNKTSITFKEIGTDVGIEIISAAGHSSPRKTAYFRRKSIFSVK